MSRGFSIRNKIEHTWTRAEMPHAVLDTWCGILRTGEEGKPWEPRTVDGPPARTLFFLATRSPIIGECREKSKRRRGLRLDADARPSLGVQRNREPASIQMAPIRKKVMRRLLARQKALLYHKVFE
jgi:hypothetical protein